MPADYKGRGHGHEKKPLPGFVWLLAGLALGLFVALLVYLDKQPEVSADFGAAVQKELEKLKHNTSGTVEANKQDEKDSERQEPKFNFYTILPELEVLIPDSETQPPETSNNEVSSAGKKYVLQAGSFSTNQDADRRRAELAMQGIESHIQRVKINDKNYHRVYIGPTEDLNRLNMLRSRLRAAKIDVFRIRISD